MDTGVPREMMVNYQKVKRIYRSNPLAFVLLVLGTLFFMNLVFHWMENDLGRQRTDLTHSKRAGNPGNGNANTSVNGSVTTTTTTIRPAHDFTGEYIKLFNQLGTDAEGYKKNTVDGLFDSLKGQPGMDSRAWDWQDTLRKRLHTMKETLRDSAKKNKHVNRSDKLVKTGVNVTVVTIACGENIRQQVQTMVKSAMISTQDSDLHLIVFSDKEAILNVAEDLLKMKWTGQELNWTMTFRLHLEWFPNTTTNWRGMWRTCATQRLWFPSLLPDVEHVIFLDADTIVISNLTEMWTKFVPKMENKLIAVGPNTLSPAKGFYTDSKIPHYGYGGLNAGIMIFNLDEMRKFDMEQRCMATFTLYHDLIVLADQDIYNILFHTYNDRVVDFSCTYNFNWSHCPIANNTCAHHTAEEGSICFCKDTLKNGVHIVHGNLGTFHRQDKLILHSINYMYQRLDLLKTPILSIIDFLKLQYVHVDLPCFSLTGDVMYKNAEKYLTKILPYVKYVETLDYDNNPVN